MNGIVDQEVFRQQDNQVVDGLENLRCRRLSSHLESLEEPTFHTSWPVWFAEFAQLTQHIVLQKILQA